MKNIYILTLLLMVGSVIEIQAQNRLSIEEEAEQSAMEFQRDLHLDDNQKEAFYKILLKSIETKRSVHEGQLSREDKSTIKETLKNDTQEMMALLNNDQKKRYKLLMEVGRLQKELEMSDLQKREMFNALAATQDSINQNMRQVDRTKTKEGNNKNMSPEEKTKMKEGMNQNMSPEEKMKMKESMNQNMSMEERVKRKESMQNMSQEERMKMKKNLGADHAMNNQDQERIRSIRQTEKTRLQDILNKAQYDKYTAITQAKTLSRSLELTNEQHKSLLNILISDLEAQDKLRAEMDRNDQSAKQKIEEGKKKLENKKNEEILALLNDQQKELFKNMPGYNRGPKGKESKN